MCSTTIVTPQIASYEVDGFHTKYILNSSCNLVVKSLKQWKDVVSHPTDLKSKLQVSVLRQRIA